uniref:GM07702p n=1 Tax=Drosophila melanogaster TaxID=7227 RepID=Q8T3N0_DROME|nr:GM07702p [Drosophila melanogaster]
MRVEKIAIGERELQESESSLLAPPQPHLHPHAPSYQRGRLQVGGTGWGPHTKQTAKGERLLARTLPLSDSCR